MSKPISILILCSIIGIISLSFIQGYLINNTYKLKKETFIKDTKNTITKFDVNEIAFDTIYDKIYEQLIFNLVDYKIDHSKRPAILSDLQTIRESVNSSYIKAYKKEFKNRKITYDLKFQKRIKSLILFQSGVPDTLYFESNSKKMPYLLGEYFIPSEKYKVDDTVLRTNYSTNYSDARGRWRTIGIEFELITENFMNANDWTTIVLSRMTGLFILSVLIFMLVIGLLYYAIKSLITQKKIADIKTDFVNNITHEFKTPLATLSLATKILEKDIVRQQPEIVDETIKSINRQSKRLQRLIDHVLDNSLGADEIQIHKRTINTKEYLHSVLDDFLLSMKDQELELKRDIPNEAIIQIDSFHFTTALFNILENAVKYSQKKPKIHFESVVDFQKLYISITDNSIGISETNQKYVFDKFFRANQNQVYNVKGLGLGLYFTHEIIKAHQGEITISSKLGKGSTFRIIIPLQ